MKYVTATVLSLVLVGCQSPEPTKAPPKEQDIATAKMENAWVNKSEVTYKGNVFNYALNPDGHVAYVMPKQRKIHYTPNDVVAIVRNQTGCKGTFEAGVLSFIGGFNGDSNLGRITGKIPHWSVTLKC